jgi:hypothetical protein
MKNYLKLEEMAAALPAPLIVDYWNSSSYTLRQVGKPVWFYLTFEPPTGVGEQESNKELLLLLTHTHSRQVMIRISVPKTNTKIEISS